MRRFSAFLSIFFGGAVLLESAFPLITTVLADDAQTITDGAKSVNEKGDLVGLFDALAGDHDGVDKEGNHTVLSQIDYLLNPSGQYIENVNGFYDNKTEGSDPSVAHKVNGHDSVCYFTNEPQNLLNHNCDIPAFGTGMKQGILSSQMKYGVQGAERSSAYLGVLGIGMPKSVKDIPLNPNDRKERYTALELFGYDLPLTYYVGEWDQIDVTNEARLYKGFGAMGLFGMTVKAIGSGLITGMKNILLGPLSAISYGANASFQTIVSSSDYNVVANHYWTRGMNFNNTLYNAYYMSDSEVTKWIAGQIKKAMSDPKKYMKGTGSVEDAIKLSPSNPDFPTFTYKEGDKTEKEQFDQWKEENKEFNDFAKSKGIDCFDKSDTYKDLLTCWVKPYSDFKKANNLSENVTSDMINQYFDAAQRAKMTSLTGISHYVLADEDGVPIGKTVEDYQQYYLKNNTRQEEFVREGAQPTRPSIEGALDNGAQSSDTRRQMFDRMKHSSSYILSPFASLGRWVAKWCAKITNSILTVSYSNYMKALRLDDVIETLTTRLRDSVFLPLSVLVVCISIVYLASKAISGGFIRTLVQLVVTYILGVAFLFNIGTFLTWAETIPTELDNVVAEAILTTNVKENDYCMATGDDAGIRQTQCAVWDIAVFEPWVQAQFGTVYPQLNDDNIKNTNKDMTGNGTVDFGGGAKINNWALYQLSKIKVGNVTKEDTSHLIGTVNHSIYRLVDMQAGPKNAEGRDTRFFSHWAGETENRSIPLFLSGCSGVLLLLVIGGLGIAKIGFALEIGLQLLIFPIILTIGLLPKQQGKTIEYALNLVALFLKRFLTGVMMAFFLNLLIVINHTPVDYTFVSLLTLSVLVALFIERKELTQLINKANAFITPQSIATVIPQSIRTQTVIFTRKVEEGFAGGLGGMVAAIGAKDEAAKTGHILPGSDLAKGFLVGGNLSERSGERREKRHQLRLGNFGILNKMAESYRAGQASGSLQSLLEHPDKQAQYDISFAINGMQNKVEFLNNELATVGKNKELSQDEAADKRGEILKEKALYEDALGTLEYVTQGKKDSPVWRSTEGMHEFHGVTKTVGGRDLDKLIYNTTFKDVEKGKEDAAVTAFMREIESVKDDLLEKKAQREEKLSSVRDVQNTVQKVEQTVSDKMGKATAPVSNLFYKKEFGITEENQKILSNMTEEYNARKTDKAHNLIQLDKDNAKSYVANKIADSKMTENEREMVKEAFGRVASDLSNGEKIDLASDNEKEVKHILGKYDSNEEDHLPPMSYYKSQKHKIDEMAKDLSRMNGKSKEEVIKDAKDK